MKREGIQKKVTKLASSLSIGSIFIIALVSILGSISMRANTVRINNTLGMEAAVGSERALENQALAQLQSLTGSKTEYADACMQAIIQENSVISGLAEDIFSHPEKYPERTALPPLAENKGILSAQILYAENADMEQAEAEAAKTANLNDLLTETVRANESLITAQIGAESGFIIMGDTNADTKADIAYLDPRERSWYIKAADAGELVWSDVVDDAFGRGLGIVCANPVYDDNGRLRGVVGVSALLTELNRVISAESLGQTSYSFALDDKGRIIISPSVTKLEDSISMTESTDPHVRALAEKMTAGESGVARLTLNGLEVYAAYAPMKLLPWSICTVVSVDEVLAPARKTAETITGLAGNAKRDIDRIILIVALFCTAAAATSAAASFGISKSFSRRITEPIERLSASVSGIKDNNLVYLSDIQTGDEIEDLSYAFENMSRELVTHIESLMRVTADKERIGAELNVATSIQAGMLPCIFPAFPEHSEFDIFASMTPAKEVGGDFYDFFLVNETKLVLVIADVSGKGVPAALFMVIAKTLIKNNAQQGKEPAEVLETVNDLLCENNEAGMFVTVFMGVLDIPSGRFTYTNAGHNPPLYKRAESQWEWLPVRPGFILAGATGTHYGHGQITLERGDKLFMYTDGVTEGVNRKNELYTEQRLLETINQSKEKTPKELLAYIKTELDAFAEGAEQADDITMLAIEIE